jgi:hypothetical protein
MRTNSDTMCITVPVPSDINGAIETIDLEASNDNISSWAADGLQAQNGDRCFNVVHFSLADQDMLNKSTTKWSSQCQRVCALQRVLIRLRNAYLYTLIPWLRLMWQSKDAHGRPRSYTVLRRSVMIGIPLLLVYMTVLLTTDFAPVHARGLRLALLGRFDGYVQAVSYSDRHVSEMRQTGQAIERFLHEHPAVTCASAVEVGSNWRHIVVRHNALPYSKLVQKSIAATLTTDGHEPSLVSGDRSRFRAGSQTQFMHWVNPQLLSLDPQGGIYEGSRGAHSRHFLTIEEKPTHCSYAFGKGHAGFATGRSYKSRTYRRATHVDVVIQSYTTLNDIISTDELAILSTSGTRLTMHEVDALCVQHYLDVFDAKWQCTL